MRVVPGGWSDLLGWPRNRGLGVLRGFTHRRFGMSYDGRISLFITSSGYEFDFRYEV